MTTNAPKLELRVLDLKASRDHAKKPKELIQITGHENLSLTARRAVTVLWHVAHRQGIEEGKDYTIELNDLRPSNTRNNDVIEEAVIALMKTLVTIQMPDGRVRRVQFLGGNDMDAPDRPAGVLTYSFDKRLIEILLDSKIWGTISLPVLMSLSSKYAVSLYELIAQWVGLSHKTHETISLEDLRKFLGVEEGKYALFGALNQYVLTPAVTEINALAPFNLTCLVIKTGRKVTHLRFGWYQKSIDEHKEAWAEMRRPKVGRRARIENQEEKILGPVSGMAHLGHENGKD